MATDKLEQANARRHESAMTAARAAIEQLCGDGQAVNFGSVARAAGVSRGWLYRQADLSESIARLRSLAPPPAQVAQRASIGSLRQRLETARAEVARLRAENSTLRDQLARQLGAQRASRPSIDHGTGATAPSSERHRRGHVPADENPF